MLKVSVEVREGAAHFRVAVYADSIIQAMSITKGRVPGRDVRVLLPIDAEEFFGGREKKAEGGMAKDSSQLGLLPDRVRYKA